MINPTPKKPLVAACLAGLAGLSMMQDTAASAVGGAVGPIATQLTSFDLTGQGMLPLGRDPAGTGGAYSGYDYVNSNIHITLSSQRTPTPGPATLGTAFLYPLTSVTPGGGGTIQNGDPLLVNSFFDVYFDVTITDIDAGKNFAAPVGDQPDGASITMQNLYTQMQLGGGNGAPCIADTSKPNYGCLPPTGSAYIGHFPINIPLGFDINGNAINDFVKFTLATHNVGDVSSTWIQGGNAFDTFNTTANVGGGVQDEGTPDPPFNFGNPLTLSGPTTGGQQVVVAAVPEPASLGLFTTGLAFLRFKRRKI